LRKLAHRLSWDDLSVKNVLNHLKIFCESVPESGRKHNRSVVYINMLTVSGGSGSAKAGPLRIGGGGGAGVKVNSRERRAERTLIWVFLAFVVLWLPFFCANLTYGLCQGYSRSFKIIQGHLFVKWPFKVVQGQLRTVSVVRSAGRRVRGVHLAGLPIVRRQPLHLHLPELGLSHSVPQHSRLPTTGRQIGPISATVFLNLFTCLGSRPVTAVA